MGGDRLDLERLEQEREDGGRGRIPVVDDDAELPPGIESSSRPESRSSA